MDEMTWTDPQLKARYERNLKAMEQRRAAHPELFNKWALPYKVFTRSSLHGIQNMRINWLMDNHPQRFREMMMANVLEEHLRDIERHIAYLSTAFDRDQAMKAREDAGYLVTKVEEDPAILYEQHRKASCLHASHILERYESPDTTAVGILHGIVREVNAHDPENDIATYLTYPSDKAIQLAGDGLTTADIAEKREMGGWNPQTDPLMRINEQGDWTGVTQQQADQIVWDNRDEILTRASYDSELSTWTLHQLDQLKEPQPAQSLDRDRPEPDHKAPAQADSTTKRHGPRL